MHLPLTRHRAAPRNSPRLVDDEGNPVSDSDEDEVGSAGAANPTTPQDAPLSPDGGGGGARESSFVCDVSATLGCDLELLPTRLCGCGSEVDDEAACAELASAFEPQPDNSRPKKAVSL